ncbi:MAG: hypothetical protein GY722_26220 [bacterium]|nr:hypothetical protein [bacterium]
MDVERLPRGGVVRSRLRYALPAAGLAIAAYLGLGGDGDATAKATVAEVGEAPSPLALIMAIAPMMVIFMLLDRRHLIEGLIGGIFAAGALGLGLRLLTPADLLHIDADQFGARGLIPDGMERSLGVSVFTLLLMALLATLEASGVLARILERVEKQAHGHDSLAQA